MAKPVDRITALEERNAKRLEKADYYSINKSAESRAWAKRHARLGNDVDTAVTAAGSKTFGIVKGGAWGLFKGIFLGFAIGLVGSVFSPATFVILMLSTMALSTIKGCRDGYYKAESQYSAQKGEKLGDKVAASGHAQEPKVRDKVLQQANEKAEEEIPELTAAEKQSTEHNEQTDTYFQDMVTESRSEESELER